MTGDKTLFSVTVNDTIFVTCSGFACGYFLYQVHFKLAVLAATRQLEAQKFLGKEVYSAIFQEKRENLEDETKHGYVVFIDIRESTFYTNHHRDQWEAFQKAWAKLSSEIVSKNGGNLLKTGGDSILLTFGLFEDTPDLSDIPGLEKELEEAEARRWRMLTSSCMNCLEQLTRASQQLGVQYFPERPIRIGIGVDRGPIKKGLRGSEHRLELDIWGDRVNCASRLEAYCKVVANQCDPASSIMVLSPFATDHIPDLTTYFRHDVQDGGIKDFPGIRWVMAKEFKSHAQSQSVPNPGRLAS
jgi:class 3 adenylate cyclase